MNSNIPPDWPAIPASNSRQAVGYQSSVLQVVEKRQPGNKLYEELMIDAASVSPFYIIWRKMIDLVFGIVGSFILLVLLPLLALCISLDSPGPIFYRQERVGYRGKPFGILKFRSMKIDAEQTGQAVWAARGDTRVTRVGRVMRVTHLDELPQVINILRGDMTLIGPRPERQAFVDRLTAVNPSYHYRLSVLPGLTGWAQVKYPYASSDDDAQIKLNYDLFYIENRCIKLDILIMLKTVVEVLACRGR